MSKVVIFCLYTKKLFLHIIWASWKFFLWRYHETLFENNNDDIIENATFETFGCAAAFKIK